MKVSLILYLTVAVCANHSVPYDVDISEDGLQITGTMQTNSSSSTSTIGPYILIGSRAVDGEFPWIVSLLISDNFLCGGSIINTRTILTAAHCVRGLQNYPSVLKIRVGSNRHNSGGYIVGVSQIKIHNSYIYSKHDYDIAILKTAAEIPINNKNIKLVQLAKQEPAPGSVVKVAGWGSINKEVTIYPDYLQWTEIKIINRTKCQQYYNRIYSISDRMICTHIEGSEKCSCYGDSGGPLTQNGIQVGIVSWGGHCVWPNYPSVDVNVANLLPWINSNKF